MKSIPASKFKAQCLALLDNLDEEGIIVTKRGKPVAQVTPVRPDPRELIGSIPDLIVDDNDPLFSTGLRWEAESPSDVAVPPSALHDHPE